MRAPCAGLPGPGGALLRRLKGAKNCQLQFMDPFSCGAVNSEFVLQNKRCVCGQRVLTRGATSRRAARTCLQPSTSS